MVLYFVLLPNGDPASLIHVEDIRVFISHHKRVLFYCTNAAMISNTLLRTTSRRLSSATASHGAKTAFSSSTTRQAFSNEEARKKVMFPVLAAASVCGFSFVFSSQEEDNTNHSVAQCLVAKSDVMLAKEEVENKFATYWPRNIMILFGPPGMSTHLRLQFSAWTVFIHCAVLLSFSFLSSYLTNILLGLDIHRRWKGNTWS
jgi:hypothetical protein